MRELCKKITYRIEGNFLLTVIRYGLVMMMPFILTGGIACAVRNLPIPAYQGLITGEDFGWIGWLLDTIYNGTFGCFSIVLAVSLAISFAMEKNETTDKAALYVVVALGAYGVQLNIGTEHFDTESFGTTGSFLAIVIPITACYLYSWLKRITFLSMKEYTVGMEVICGNAIQAFLPVLLIIGFYALLAKGLTILFGVYSLQSLISNAFCTLFENSQMGFWQGLGYTLVLHVLWVFGIHGSHVLEPVAQNVFTLQDGVIFSKSMFDIYVVIGGCGATICVLVALLIFFRKDRMNRIAKLAFPTVIFNLNEVLNFGLPIVFNPILAVPFILTPLICYIISYGGVYWGLVPPLTQDISWTTPVLISGYMATGSIRGSLLQLFCIILGVFIYLPFLHINKKAREKTAKNCLKLLISELQELEQKNEVPKYLVRTDKMGLVARMIMQDLKMAIKKKELFLLYQPQINSENVCLGAEALIRWKHPMFGYIYPPLIIYLAKERGFLPQLESLLFEMACEAIQITSKEYDGDFKISVNITAKSLLWDIEKCIEENLKKYQIPTEKLWIEITEQDMIANSNIVIDKLSRLKKVGHTLLIDDFGMGHTSLLYLQSNYFDVVKLDGSLVGKMLDLETNQKIISSIVKLGSELDVAVIAEYVENNQQKEKLLELGCKRYQGYLFSKPVSLEDFIAYLKAHGEKKGV
ncbi:MAG: PTS sugar transporter subunit IIC/EAL domain-containing protein [Lachnospiraceae bacterium]|nr:PTS sugar transporter subunit IIC/EAL domain-containing protein [Lachnospiraceae bacterium]